MCIFQVTLLLFIVLIRKTQTVEIAREVDGGVELLSTGEIELILPDELSFTVKSAGPFVGKAEFCYAAKTTVEKIWGYDNYDANCPLGMCVFLIYDDLRAHGLRTERRGSVVHYQFVEINADMWCPRLVINGRQNFTIVRLPQVPVIVNGASLPKEETTSAAISTKWIVIICLLVLLLILIVVFVGVCIYTQIKKRHNSVKHVQFSTKSKKSHCKTSPVVVSPVSSKRHQSKRDVQVNSSNSANNNEDV